MLSMELINAPAVTSLNQQQLLLQLPRPISHLRFSLNATAISNSTTRRHQKQPIDKSLDLQELLLAQTVKERMYIQLEELPLSAITLMVELFKAATMVYSIISLVIKILGTKEVKIQIIKNQSTTLSRVTIITLLLTTITVGLTLIHLQFQGVIPVIRRFNSSKYKRW